MAIRGQKARAAREGQTGTLQVAHTRWWYGGRCGAAAPRFAERLRLAAGLDVDGGRAGRTVAGRCFAFVRAERDELRPGCGSVVLCIEQQVVVAVW